MTRKTSKRAGFERVFGEEIGQSIMSGITVATKARRHEEISNVSIKRRSHKGIRRR